MLCEGSEHLYLIMKSRQARQSSTWYDLHSITASLHKLQQTLLESYKLYGLPSTNERRL